MHMHTISLCRQVVQIGKHVIERRIARALVRVIMRVRMTMRRVIVTVSVPLATTGAARTRQSARR